MKKTPLVYFNIKRDSIPPVVVGNRKSTFERFKEKNPIEEMLFSEKNQTEDVKQT